MAAAIAVSAQGLHAQQSVTSEPAEGSLQGHYNQITLTFEGAKQAMPEGAMFDPSNGPVTFTNVETGVVASNGGGLPTPFLNNQIFIQLAKDVVCSKWIGRQGVSPGESYGNVHPEGEYELFIPAGNISLTDAAGNVSKNADIRLRFNLGMLSYSDVAITCNVPASVETLAGGELTFSPMPADVKINPSAKEGVSLIDMRGLTMNVATFNVQLTETGATFALAEPWWQPGPYSVKVPEGFFIFDGNANREKMFSVTVKGDGNITCTIVPENESTVETLESITMQWRGVLTLEIDENLYEADTTTAYFYNAVADKRIRAVVNYAPDANYKLVIVPTSELFDGEWVLTFPEDTVTIDGKSNEEEMTYSWTVGNGTGIEMVENEMNGETYYTVHGTPAKQPLAKGIYFAKGKKILVK